jgi:hypothetical protein
VPTLFLTYPAAEAKLRHSFDTEMTQSGKRTRTTCGLYIFDVGRPGDVRLLQALHTPASLVTRLAYRSRETLRIPVSASQNPRGLHRRLRVSCRYIGWLVGILETRRATTRGLVTVALRLLQVCGAFKPYGAFFRSSGDRSHRFASGLPASDVLRDPTRSRSLKACGRRLQEHLRPVRQLERVVGGGDAFENWRPGDVRLPPGLPASDVLRDPTRLARSILRESPMPDPPCQRLDGPVGSDAGCSTTPMP